MMRFQLFRTWFSTEKLTRLAAAGHKLGDLAVLSLDVLCIGRENGLLRLVKETLQRRLVIDIFMPNRPIAHSTTNVAVLRLPLVVLNQASPSQTGLGRYELRI